MVSILSLGRLRLATLLAWLAVASLGAMGVPPESAAVDGLQSHAVARAAADGPGPIVRVAAAKIATALRHGDDDPRGPGSAGAADVPRAIAISAPAKDSAIKRSRHVHTPPVRRIYPYTARAPPLRRS